MNSQYLWEVGSRLLRASPEDVVRGLLSSSVVCAVLGLVIAIVWTLIRKPRETAPLVVGPRGERVGLGVIALFVGAVWVLDIGLRGYVFDMSNTVSWWRFAVAPSIAAFGLGAWAVTRRTREPRRVVDAGAVTRRTWTTFGPRRGILLFFVLIALAGSIAVVFGRMSTAFDSGIAAHVALPVPNTDVPPVVTIFPGWAYGIPLIVALAALGAATVLALSRNAVCAFPGNLSLDTERARRAGLARDVAAIAIAATLVSFAGLLRMARASAATTIAATTDSGRVAVADVHLPHADLILVGGLLAPALEIAGCALLALLVARGILLVGARRVRSTSRPGVIA